MRVMIRKKIIHNILELPQNHLSIHYHIEQRAVREALARDNQIREMFADLDTNNDSL